jgi:Protein of unknown function (DUF669)
MTEGLGPLNLEDADMRGFDAVPANRYNAEVYDLTMDAVKNTQGRGKLPAGTPMVKVQFRITDEEFENRRVFQTFPIPPDSYDPKKAQMMKGMLARFFVALGEKEETVLSKKYNPDFEDFVGRPCVITVSRQPKKTSEGEEIPGEFNNRVTGIKPAGSLAGSGDDHLL